MNALLYTLLALAALGTLAGLMPHRPDPRDEALGNVRRLFSRTRPRK